MIFQLQEIQTRRRHNNAEQQVFESDKEYERFRQRYPQLDITGKSNDLYKMHEVLSHIKDTHDERDLNRRLIKVLNQKHLEMTGAGNRQATGKDFQDIYESRLTQNYINVRCHVSRKCRFAMWYKYDRASD